MGFWSPGPGPTEGDDTFSGDPSDETADGLGGNDLLVGDFGDDTLRGGSGGDFFDGGPGADILDGGEGDDWFSQYTHFADVDVISGGAGFDIIDYRDSFPAGAIPAGGPVIVQLSGYATNRFGVLNAIFTGIEAAVGTPFNDALIGNDADNRLEGLAGPDWLVGGGGDDWFVQEGAGAVDRLFGGLPGADSGFDTIDYSAANAGVVVQLSGYAMSNGAVLALFQGIEAAVGSAFDDAMIGTVADNRLVGGAGSDWLVGQGGDDSFGQGTESGVDRLFGDAGIDTIDYSAASAGVVVQLNGWSTLSGGATLATFTGVENAVGGTFNDALIGSAANNRITGGSGADWLVGGLGADAFVYLTVNDGAGDSIRDFSQAQTDGIDLSAIDANPLTGADDPFVFATTRHAGVVGEAIVTTFAGSSLVSLYVDADNIADMTIQVVHQQGLVMNAGDFVL